MTQQNAALSLLLEMEADLADVERWGNALVAMGTGGNHVHPGALYVVGVTVEELGKRIDQRWNKALNAARFDGVGPCA